MDLVLLDPFWSNHLAASGEWFNYRPTSEKPTDRPQFPDPGRLRSRTCP